MITFIYRIIERNTDTNERKIVWSQKFTKETANAASEIAMQLLNRYRNDRSKAERYAYALWEDIYKEA